MANQLLKTIIYTVDSLIMKIIVICIPNPKVSPTLQLYNASSEVSEVVQGGVSPEVAFCFVFSHTSLLPAPGSQDSKDGLSASARGTDDEKPPSMPEETGKSKVASWLTSQGLKKVSTEEIK